MRGQCCHSGEGGMERGHDKVGGKEEEEQRREGKKTGMRGEGRRERMRREGEGRTKKRERGGGKEEMKGRGGEGKERCGGRKMECAYKKKTMKIMNCFSFLLPNSFLTSLLHTPEHSRPDCPLPVISRSSGPSLC